jgi:hypothetical protein
LGTEEEEWAMFKRTSERDWFLLINGDWSADDDRMSSEEVLQCWDRVCRMALSLRFGVRFEMEMSREIYGVTPQHITSQHPPQLMRNELLP